LGLPFKSNDKNTMSGMNKQIGATLYPNKNDELITHRIHKNERRYKIMRET
jgi:hypothetical protein